MLITSTDKHGDITSKPNLQSCIVAKLKTILPRRKAPVTIRTDYKGTLMMKATPAKFDKNQLRVGEEW